jgi:hypothetical protein
MLSVFNFARTGRPGVRIPVGSKIFLFSESSRQALGPPSLIPNTYRATFPAVKRPRREVNHSPSSSSKTEWSCTSIPPVCLHCVDTENFTFYLILQISLDVL